MKRLVIAIIVLVGCTDAELADFRALGQEHRIRCYSGELLIYDGIATGTVASEGHSDGYYFNDKKTNTVIRVSGNCLIEILP